MEFLLLFALFFCVSIAMTLYLGFGYWVLNYFLDEGPDWAGVVFIIFWAALGMSFIAYAVGET